MRRVALVPGGDDVKRLILYEAPDGVYLFKSRSTQDRGAFADEWYETVEDAEAVSREHFGVDAGMWQEVPDPAPGCQHDWIAPVRIKGRDTGNPQWGVLERLVDGVWVSVTEEE